MNSHSTITELLQGQIPVLGIALLAAVIGGKFAKMIHVPKVTMYILVGVILGPTFFNLITEQMSKNLSPFNDLAFGLILFNIGGEFHKELFSKMAWKHVKFSLLFAFFTATIVFLICMGVTSFTNLTLIQRFTFSSFLGIISIAAAPPTTLLVLKETESDGPLAHIIMVFLAIGTICSIFGTNFATLSFQHLGIWANNNDYSLSAQFARLAWGLGGSFFIGITLGLILSYFVQKETKKSDITLAVFCVILFGQTIAYYLGVEPLLISLFLGFSLVNTSPAGERIHKVVNEIGLSIYAIFFVLAGSHIHVQKQLQTIGILGLGYIIARTIGIYTGAKLANKMIKEDKVIGDWIGTSVLSHAGAAIAIVTKLKGNSDASAQAIITVIMASVFIFEILGPIALKFSLGKAGELNKNTKNKKIISKLNYTFAELAQNFFKNIGLNKNQNIERLNTIEDQINTNIPAILENANYNDIIKFINENTFPIYPVVNNQHKFLGTISLEKIKTIPLDSSEVTLVLAHTLLGSDLCLSNSSKKNDALVFFQQKNITTIPVIDSSTKKYLGLIFYKDLLVGL